jgi:VIT1/CCC1 family predicted Fe2+/Mn2+ transporter
MRSPAQDTSRTMTGLDMNQDLLHYVGRSLDDEEEFHFLQFESLQRTNIVALQVDLIALKLKLGNAQQVSAEELNYLKNTLKDYGKSCQNHKTFTADKPIATAVRDYQFLRSRKSVARKDMHTRRQVLQKWFQNRFGRGDVFWSHYSYFDEAVATIDPLRNFLMSRLPVSLTYSGSEKNDRVDQYQSGGPPKDVSATVDHLARFIIAITGGLFLIVPMLIMAIDTSQKKSLITVSLAVFLFALALSFGVRTSNVEALVSTATYAAVLVVFVGTNSGDSSAVVSAGNSTATPS